MKKFFSMLVVYLLANQFHVQGQEFEVHSNGLIYSESTMGKLSQIVDSLNLKYKTCDFNKVFYSKEQAVVTVVELKGENTEQAKKDIENNISLTAFKVKYPEAKIIENSLLVKFQYKNYDDEEMINFSEVALGQRYGKNLRFPVKEAKELLQSNPKWIYQYHEKAFYSKESLSAFYLLDKLSSQPLPDRYARAVGYSDCLIDTTSTKFKKEVKTGMLIELPKSWKQFSKKKKEKLLDKKRSTRVIGGCSMDSSPRVHAMQIAVLSAETTNWEVFLKAHLDILNDRFDRVSDGSYAWEERNTYIKELEELDIDVLKLIIGISLRVENAADNHYYGSIGRIGRALSEAKDKELIEKQLFSMMADEKLDDYNRVIAYYLLDNYAHYLDEKEQEEKKELFEAAAKKLPKYLIKDLVQD